MAKVTPIPVYISDIPGPAGSIGETGAAGEDGATWYISSEATPDPVTVPSPMIGDLFLYPASGDVFRYSGSDWVWQGSIRGPQGPKGEQGDPGSGGGGGAEIVPVQFGDYQDKTNTTTTWGEYAGADIALTAGTWLLVGLGTMLTKNVGTGTVIAHGVLIDSAVAGSLNKFASRISLTDIIAWSVIPGAGSGAASVVIPPGGATVHVALAWYGVKSGDTATCYNGAFSGFFVKTA